MSSSSSVEEYLAVPWWRSFIFRFVSLYSLLATVLLGVGIFWIHETQTREIVDKYGLVLESVAASVGPFVDGDELGGIRENDDVASPQFRRVRARLAAAIRQTGLAEDQLYILRPDKEEPNLYRFVVMLQEKTFVGDPYRPPKELHDLYRWVIEKNDAVHTPIFTDAHGTFISGIAPIVNDNGEVVAVLQADYGIHTYLAEADALARRLVLEGVSILIVIVVFGAWMHRRLRRDVNELLEGTRAIRDERYEHHIPLKSRDELGTLSLALNEALRKLAERFVMLKFLPRHTKRMIERSLEGGGVVGLDNPERVRVVVLNTDIRRFTDISEQLTPEAVIGMLNKYIRAQAEIVEQFGGSVDKYMGDAVLAVFEGEEMERRALQAAWRIQQEVQRMNATGAFQMPIHVGVGLSVGEVVMGNMGSEQRMEHTVIGATVNLASRFCSEAGAGEIIVGAAILEQVSPNPAQKREEIRVKGFKDPAPCYRLMAVKQPAPA